jgi:hypothetical protein
VENWHLSRVVLDTDILSDLLAGKDANVTASARAYREAQGRYTFTVIAVVEIVRGLLFLPNTPSAAKSLSFVEDRASVAGRGEPLPFFAPFRTRLLQDAPPIRHGDPGAAPSTRRPQTLGEAATLTSPGKAFSTMRITPGCTASIRGP